MSSHPNTLLVASIRPPNGQPDEFLENHLDGNEEIFIANSSYDIVKYENLDLNIHPEEEYFCIYEYLTYGWGDAIELHEALAKIDNFKTAVEDYCELHNCTYKFHLTANFW